MSGLGVSYDFSSLLVKAGSGLGSGFSYAHTRLRITFPLSMYGDMSQLTSKMDGIRLDIPRLVKIGSFSSSFAYDEKWNESWTGS